MAEATRQFDQDAAQRTWEFVHSLLRDYPNRDFTVELWNGECWLPEKNQFHRFTWKINRPDALKTVLLSSNRQIALAEAYIYGDFDIVGDIEAIFPLAEHFITRKWSVQEKLNLLRLLGWSAVKPTHDTHRLAPHPEGQLHSRRRDGQAVRYHYDVSNDFYALWLDPNMVYSCAYFEHADDDLGTAQKNKLDYVCRKLRLKAGERLLDIGCGWGGLIVHAARQYGVRAVGVTLSQRQFTWAQERIRDFGLSEQCEVRLLDYRDVDEAGAYDKLVSIGMVEHVGESRLTEYFGQAYRLLRSGGVFLNSGIGRPGKARIIDNQPTFTDRYIFPDGELVSIGSMLSHAERAGFEVCDVENLREHYRLTVTQWLHRLDKHAEEARRLVGEDKYRMWRLYLAGSAYYFQRGWLDLYHTLLLKSEDGKTNTPLTRAEWH